MNTDDIDRFGDLFSVTTARLHGVSRGRLRRTDLAAPFHGVRLRRDAADPLENLTGQPDPYQRQRMARVAQARVYSARLHAGHFFSHQTAASIWDAPLPLEFSVEGELLEGTDLPLHVSASGFTPFPRATGIVGHRTLQSLTAIRTHDGLRVTSPAATWVSLGTLSTRDLVALGDYFCRRWRAGHGRRDVGRAPLATIDEMRELLEAGRRRGAARLREALDLIREDAWSPRESQVRLVLVGAGLPEPELNIDVHDARGRFIGCVDLAYREQRVAIEYLGMVHGATWAADVERLAALRAAGWTVIEVTAPLLRRPEELVRRVAAALGLAFE